MSQILLAVLVAAGAFLFYLGLRRIARIFTRSACGCGHDSADGCADCADKGEGADCCCHEGKDKNNAGDSSHQGGTPDCCCHDRKATSSGSDCCASCAEPSPVDVPDAGTGFNSTSGRITGIGSSALETSHDSLPHCLKPPRGQ